MIGILYFTYVSPPHSIKLCSVSVLCATSITHDPLIDTPHDSNTLSGYSQVTPNSSQIHHLIVRYKTSCIICHHLCALYTPHHNTQQVFLTPPNNSTPLPTIPHLYRQFNMSRHLQTTNPILKVIYSWGSKLVEELFLISTGLLN